MGYLHIENFYKSQDILLFKRCYALEKIHGTSAHISWNKGKLGFFAGGESHERFVKLFDTEYLTIKLTDLFGTDKVIIYGEAYGGKCQGMSKTYGPDLKFVVFDVQVRENWLSVPQAVDVISQLNLEFVDWAEIPAEIDSINTARDDPSIQAIRNGMGSDKIREGVVLRPLIELITNNGNRLIVKHKRDEFKERTSIPEIDPAKRQLMEDAQAIADEWVVPMRLQHVLDKLTGEFTIQRTGEVIKAMVEDVTREAEGEIVDNAAVQKTIGTKAAKLYKEYLNNQ